jgi:hypothetical protein
MSQSVGHRLFDGLGHGAPRALKQPSDLLPRQGPGPGRQRHHQGSGHLLFPADPGHRLDMDAAAPRTTHSSRRIAKLHRDPPHRHVTKASSATGITIRRGLQTATTTRRISPVSSDRRHQSSRAAGDAHHTKPLQLDRCLDQTLNKHEFPRRYIDTFTTSKYLMELMLFKPHPLSTCTDS